MLHGVKLDNFFVFYFILFVIYSGFPLGTHQVSHNNVFFKCPWVFFTLYKGITKTNEHSFMISKHVKVFGEKNGPNGFVRF